MSTDYINSKEAKAREFFQNGANCAQAVLCAFADECGMPQDTLMKIASGFGGGFARMRLVCGTVSGMFLAADLIRGFSDLSDKQLKDDHYAFLQKLAKRFQAETGSLICRELLGLPPEGNDASVSTPRTPDFYKKRPCVELCALAAGILAEELEATNK